MNKLKHFVKKYWRELLFTGLVTICALLATIAVCWRLISPSGSFILNDTSAKSAQVGLVLGAGIGPSGKPYTELEARLNVAANALQAGQVKKLIVSGDNRFKNYDEPTAMRDYLVQKRHIDTALVVRDFAGRSTYESCERASKVFGQNKLIIFSAESHLPRAIYLCRHFGIESYGVSSGIEANNSGRREVLARVKAVYNIYFHGEPTVLGQPEKI